MKNQKIWRHLCVATLALSIAACKAGDSTSSERHAVNTDSISTTGPASISLRKQFACLPKEAAFTAAHRGTSKKSGLAENSAGSLKTLIEHGVLIAEVDVAGLKDGTLVLFHDGVWDEKSTGKGPVASSNWDQVQNFLLLDTEGDFSSDRPVKLSDALSLAKNTLYLEIDFKSSARYEDVIGAVRDAGMSDHVLLIAYNDGQAKKLASLAPEMMLSVGAKSMEDIKHLEQAGVKRENMAVWMGRGPYDAAFIAALDEAGIEVLAWPNRDAEKSTTGPATLMVTDYALKTTPIRGLSAEGRKAYEACLQTKS